MSAKPSFIDYSGTEFNQKFDSERPRYSGRAVNALLRSVGETSQADDGTTVFDVVIAPSEGLAFDIAQGIEAVNFLLVAARCTVKLRPIIDLLLGFAGSQTDPLDWFEAPDVVVGVAARTGALPPLPPSPMKDPDAYREARLKYKDDLMEWVEEHSAAFAPSERAMQTWTARQRKALIAWQQATNFTLIEVEEGDYDSKLERNAPTRYRIPLLKLAVETLERAKGNTMLWSRNPREAIKQAAFGTFEDLPEAPAVRQRAARGKTDAAKRLERNRKTIMTLLAQCRDDLQELHQDQTEFLEDLKAEAEAVFSQQGLCLVVTPEPDRETGRVHKSVYPSDEQPEPQKPEKQVCTVLKNAPISADFSSPSIPVPTTDDSQPEPSELVYEPDDSEIEVDIDPIELAEAEAIQAEANGLPIETESPSDNSSSSNAKFKIGDIVYPITESGIRLIGEGSPIGEARRTEAGTWQYRMKDFTQWRDEHLYALATPTPQRKENRNDS